MEAPLVTRRNDIQVKIDAEVFTEAKMVSASRNVPLAEYLSDILRPIVRRDLEAEMRKRMGEQKPKASK
jgi:hypothetical protein